MNSFEVISTKLDGYSRFSLVKGNDNELWIRNDEFDYPCFHSIVKHEIEDTWNKINEIKSSVNRIVVCAAHLYRQDGYEFKDSFNILPCIRHNDCIVRNQIVANGDCDFKVLNSGGEVLRMLDGFVDNKKVFHNREVARRIVLDRYPDKTFINSKELFSEDLY